MSQETLKMLKKAREQLAATTTSLEKMVMELITSRLQMMDNLSPSSVLEQEQRLHLELKLLNEDVNQEPGEGHCELPRDSGDGPDHL